MITEKLRVVQLIVFIILASQGMFYFLAGAEALRNVSVPTFAEQRKAVDLVIGTRLQILYYAAIIIGFAIMVLSAKSADWRLFIITTIATVLIVTDVVLAVKFNIPINKAFLNYPDEGGVDWRLLQISWLKMIVIRGVFTCTALFVLLFSWFKSAINT